MNLGGVNGRNEVLILMKFANPSYFRHWTCVVNEHADYTNCYMYVYSIYYQNGNTC